MWGWIKLLGISVLIINIFVGLVIWRIYVKNKDEIIVVREEDL
jgi:hypothetical protein